MKLGESIFGEAPEFPWIKEYNRFVSKCTESEINQAKTIYSHQPNHPITPLQNITMYNLTQDLKQAKDKEWWYRQKYKLMKALKLKWEESKPKTSKIAKMLNYKPKQDQIDYNHMQSTTISLEKIPMLKSSGVDYIDGNSNTNLSTNADKNEQGISKNKDTSTNTGPDVILMLNDLKRSKAGNRYRENSNEVNEMYRQVNQQDSLNSDLFNSDMKTNSAYMTKNSYLRSNGTQSLHNFTNKIENDSKMMLRSGKSNSRYSRKSRKKMHASQSSSSKKGSDRHNKYNFHEVEELADETLLSSDSKYTRDKNTIDIDVENPYKSINIKSKSKFDQSRNDHNVTIPEIGVIDSKRSSIDTHSSVQNFNLKPPLPYENADNAKNSKATRNYSETKAEAKRRLKRQRNYETELHLALNSIDSSDQSSIDVTISSCKLFSFRFV